MKRGSGVSQAGLGVLTGQLVCNLQRRLCVKE